MVKLTTPQELELRRLRHAFVSQLPERVDAIESALGELMAGGSDDGRVDALFHLVHRLCGSAGIYGYQQVHLAAAALEGAADGLRTGRARGPEGALASLGPLFESLRRASADATSQNR